MELLAARVRRASTPLITKLSVVLKTVSYVNTNHTPTKGGYTVELGSDYGDHGSHSKLIVVATQGLVVRIKLKPAVFCL